MTDFEFILHSNTLFLKGTFEPRVTQGPIHVGNSIESLKRTSSKKLNNLLKKPSRFTISS